MSVRTHLRRLAALGAVGAVALAATGCTATAPAGDDEPRRYDLATYVAPTAPHGKTLVWMIEEIAERSDGRILIEPYWQSSLIPADELLTATADGLADFAFLTPQYNPAELPLSQVTSIPFVTSDLGALGSALSTLTAESEAYQNEWASAGVTPLAFATAAPTMFAAKEPVTGLDWLEGKSIRAAGYAASAVQAAGGNAVSLVVGELYESIERGLLDGYTSMIFDAVPSLSLEEVAPHIADTGIGVYTFNAIIANPQAWDGMPEADRELIQGVIDEFGELYLENLAAGEDEACDVVLAAGGSVTVWDASETRAWAELIGDEPLQQWKAAAEAAGAPADEFHAEYLAAIRAAESGSALTGMARCASR